MNKTALTRSAFVIVAAGLSGCGLLGDDKPITYKLNQAELGNGQTVPVAQGIQTSGIFGTRSIVNLDANDLRRRGIDAIPVTGSGEKQTELRAGIDTATEALTAASLAGQAAAALKGAFTPSSNQSPNITFDPTITATGGKGGAGGSAKATGGAGGESTAAATGGNANADAHATALQNQNQSQQQQQNQNQQLQNTSTPTRPAPANDCGCGTTTWNGQPVSWQLENYQLDLAKYNFG